MRPRTPALLLVLAAGAGPLLPAWLVSIATVALANGLVVLGLVVLWRAGLVPFGQALFYASGAYAVALLSRRFGSTDAFLSVAVGAVAGGACAFLVGALLARYREIFFAMLSLALSMILYGVLVKTQSLGSTDGFNVAGATFFGREPTLVSRPLALYWLAAAVAAAAIVGVGFYFRSVAGALCVPIRDNEIRVEYLGLSVTRLVHLQIVLGGILAGAGGSLAALTIGHVDPSMSYWTTSGGFVFVTILSGSTSVVTPFLGALLFELVRTAAVAFAPTSWQFVMGCALLATIVFLPEGLASLRTRLRLPAWGRSP